MRDTSAEPAPDGEAAVDVERPTGHPRPRYTIDRGVPRRRRRRLAWARAAMALVMVAQLVVGIVTPFVHARAQSSIGAHLETQGARRHYIHDEGRCAVCAARHVVAVVVPQPPGLPLSRSHAVVVCTLSADAHPRARRTPSAPRAPPPPARIA